ncbi:hypothetical protein BXZ70DRAFT_957730 [Cristinia sonorae]|uniref:F-box domain-containing protein n=1 Tax=Cristinia sonorae TaxID=1940300 RepID=A0A8K0UG91_9AGAR|nr:hypothetical protein BXZ70DRAFT_957730 [Cristinia sonorae]
MEDIHCVKCSPPLAGLLHKLLNVDMRVLSSVDVAPFLEGIDNAIAACESIINGYKRLLSSLRTKQNSLALVHRLPDEFLESVFWRTVDWSEGSRNALLLSHVCHRWRNVALQSPRLWSVIVVSGQVKPSLFQVFIGRAHYIPLRILLSDDIKYPGRNPMTKLASVASEIYPVWKRYHDLSSHAQEIRWKFHHICTGAEITSQLNAMSFNNLELLDVQVDLSDPPQPVISLSTFSQGLPSLRTLSLSCGKQEPVMFRAGAFHLSEIISALRLMPRLESLTLFAVFSSWHVPKDYAVHPVTLHKLKTLHLSDRLDHLLSLLQAIETPVIEDCYIYEVGSRSNVPSLTEVYQRLASPVERIIGHPPTQTYHVKLAAQRCLFVSPRWLFEISPIIPRLLPLRKVQVVLDSDNRLLTQPQRLSQVSAVVSLELCGPLQMADTYNIKIHAALMLSPTLEIIRFKSCTVANISNLAVLPSPTSEDTTDLPRVANLKHLRFENLVMTLGVEGAVGWSTAASPIVVLLDILKSCLQTFRKLESIEFIQCGFSDEEAAAVAAADERISVVRE